MHIKEFQKKFDIQATQDFRISNFGLTTSSIKNTTSYATNKRYLKQALDNKNIFSIITTQDLQPLAKDKITVISIDPLKSFYDMYHYWLEKGQKRQKVKTIISKTATVHPSAIVSDYDVFIGENVVIEENVVIKEGVSIGNSSIIRTGTVLGCEGFHVNDLNGIYVTFRHNGFLKIGSRVEVQSLCTIDRGIFQETTIIGNNVVIGNLTQISHNCEIGHNTVILPQATIAGSAKIGSHVYIAPGAIISNVKIGDNSRVSIGSVVGSNVKKNITVTGNFAVEHTKFLRQLFFLRKNVQ